MAGDLSHMVTISDQLWGGRTDKPYHRAARTHLKWVSKNGKEVSEEDWKTAKNSKYQMQTYKKEEERYQRQTLNFYRNVKGKDLSGRKWQLWAGKNDSNMIKSGKAKSEGKQFYWRLGLLCHKGNIIGFCHPLARLPIFSAARILFFTIACSKVLYPVADPTANSVFCSIAHCSSLSHHSNFNWFLVLWIESLTRSFSCTGWFPQTGKNYEAMDASCNSSLVSGCFQVLGNSLTFTLSAGWFL